MLNLMARKDMLLKLLICAVSRYIKTLILGHYAFSEKKDPFWIEARKRAENSKEIVEFFKGLKNKEFPTEEDVLDPSYPFCQWNELLKGFNKPHYYPAINSDSRNKMFMANYYSPNHFDYITELRKNYV
jgi:hypothetical protein